MPSYAPIKESDMKWKKADSFDFSHGFNFLSLVYEGIRSEVSTTEDDQNNLVKESSWI